MKRRARLLIFFTSLVLVAAAAYVYRRSAPRNLATLSQPLVSVKGWWTDDDPLVRPYTWLTNDMLFSHGGWWRLEKPYIYDLKMRSKRPLDRLEKLLGSDDLIEFWAISPDRHHITWNTQFNDTIHTAALDGTEHQVWSVNGLHYGNQISDLWWLADGHRWAASTLDYQSEADKLSCIGDTFGHTLVAISKSQALSLSAAPRQHDNLTPGSVEPEASPDGKHIAWLASRQRPRPLDTLFHKLYHQYRAAQHTTTFLWVSRPDGTIKREVGAMDNPDGNSPTELQWMPDGKRVSYIYKHEIYAVDVSECL